MIKANYDTVVLWYSDPSFFLPPKLSNNQITGILTDFIKSASSALNTPIFPIPRGEFDTSKLLNSNSIEKPHYLFVCIDSTIPYMPRNLKNSALNTYICLGDSHHLPNPISRLRKFIESEEVDGVIFTNNVRHQHWFRDITKAKFYFEPGIFAHNFENERLLYKNRDHKVILYGQIGNFHPRRARIAPLLIAKNKVNYIKGSNASLSEALHTSTAALNITLNADLNSRIFEIAQTGALLIIDEIATNNGNGTVLIPDQNCLMYKTAEELELILDRKSQLSSMQKSLGLKLYTEFKERWGINNIRRKLSQQKISGVCTLNTDTRNDSRLSIINSLISLDVRLAFYEYFLELHRCSETINVLINSKFKNILREDLNDLPRLNIADNVNSLVQNQTNVYIEDKSDESNFKINILTKGIS